MSNKGVRIEPKIDSTDVRDFAKEDEDALVALEQFEKSLGGSCRAELRAIMTNPKKVDLDPLLDENGNEIPTSHDIRSVGPSDSSDTGADMARRRRGLTAPAIATAPASAPASRRSCSRMPTSAPIASSMPNEAGLGGGLDQAEEAQLGVTDEEIEAAVVSSWDSIPAKREPVEPRALATPDLTPPDTHTRAPTRAACASSSGRCARDPCGRSAPAGRENRAGRRTRAPPASA